MSFRSQLMQPSWRDGQTEASEGRRPAQGHTDVQQKPRACETRPTWVLTQSSLNFRVALGKFHHLCEPRFPNQRSEQSLLYWVVSRMK